MKILFLDVDQHGQSAFPVSQLGCCASGPPGGSGQLKTPTQRPAHWAPSQPPAKPPISLPLTLQVDGVLTFNDGSGSLDPRRLTTLSDLVKRVPDLHICISSKFGLL